MDIQEICDLIQSFKTSIEYLTKEHKNPALQKLCYIHGNVPINAGLRILLTVKN